MVTKLNLKFKLSKKKRKKIILNILLLYIIILIFSGINSNADATILSTLGSVATSGLIGFFLFLPMIISFALIGSLHSILTFVVMGPGILKPVTPDDIFFNKVPLTNLDFFDFTNVGEGSGHGASAILAVRDVVAQWFVILTGISLVLLFVILIYISIRIIIGSASEKALYKTTLIDWGVSVALLFLMLVFIIGVIKANNFLVYLIESNVDQINVFWDLISGQFGNVFSSGSILEIASYLGDVLIDMLAFLIIYGMIVYYTFVFFIQYLKRLFKVMFLIIISPLVSITYSVDKIGNKKANTLNNWMQEFLGAILIQPFHALIYAMLLYMSIAIITQSNSGLTGGLIAIIGFHFLSEAEGLVKSIFGIKKATSMSDGQQIASALMKTKLIDKGVDRIRGTKIVNVSRNRSQYGRINHNPGDKSQVLSSSQQGQTYQIPGQAPGPVSVPVQMINETQEQEQETQQQTIKITEPQVQTAQGVKGNVDTTLPIYAIQLPPTKTTIPKEKRRTIKGFFNRNEANGETAPKELKRKNTMTKALALTGMALEAGDKGDDVFKNLIQGASAGAVIGIGADNLIYNKRAKDRQRAVYKANVDEFSKELAKTAEMYGTFKDINMNNYDDAGKQAIQDWIDYILDNISNGSISKDFESKKQSLINIYKAQGFNDFEASIRVEDLGNEALVRGTGMNVNEYTTEEKEFLGSLMQVKVISDKTELESLTNLLEGDGINAFDDTRRAIEYDINDSTKPAKFTADTDDIIESSNQQTFIGPGLNEIKTEYLEKLSEKDIEVERHIKNLDQQMGDYAKKFDKSEAELEAERVAQGKTIEQFTNEHNDFVNQIKVLKNNLKNTISKKYTSKLTPEIELNPNDTGINTVSARTYIQNSGGLVFDIKNLPQDEVSSRPSTDSVLDRVKNKRLNQPGNQTGNQNNQTGNTGGNTP